MLIFCEQAVFPAKKTSDETGRENVERIELLRQKTLVGGLSPPDLSGTGFPPYAFYIIVGIEA